jgi:hypothetical protein
MQPEQILLRPGEPGGFSTPIAKESLGVPDQPQLIQRLSPQNSSFSPQ